MPLWRVNIKHRCDDQYFFLFYSFFLKKKKNIQTDHHSGTTTCRSANIWHMLHNMYLIIRVISNNEIHHDTIIIIAEKHIYNITYCLYKRAINSLSV
jgi:hypothetical protein